MAAGDRRPWGARLRVTLAGVFLLGCQGASGPAAPARQPNVLLVTFDTTRADHVGWGGGKPGVTPMLDGMARRGARFNTCLTAQPLTLPSHTSILTGLYPTHHGVRNNGTYVVAEEQITLAERLKAAGYETHATISAFVLDSQFGLDQGFDSYDDDLSGGPKQKLFMFKETPADVTTIRAVTWLRNRPKKDAPFFLWIHYFDPHADYEPPADSRALFPGDPYSAEIHHTDRELGRVFKELDVMGQLADTLFVFTSDHGDGLGEHGEKTHGIFIYESTTRVPLLISGPGVPADRALEPVVRTVDIVPTVLDLVGVPVPEGLDGASLRPLWEGTAPPRQAYVETMMTRQNFGWSELRGLRTDETKVIQAPRPEVYDLRVDPHEVLNIAQEPAGQTGAPAALLSDLRTLTTADPLNLGQHQQASLDDETRRKLVALGYVWSDEADEAGALPDPKDRLPYWEAFQAAQGLIRQKRYPEARAAIESLLAEDPDNDLARGSLANCLAAMDDREGALAVYAQMRRGSGGQSNAWLAPARLLTELGRPDEAEALIREAMTRWPESPDALVAMGDLLVERQAYAEAEVWFRRALLLDEHSSLALSGLGNCLNRAGKGEEAYTVLAAAYRRDPNSHALAYNLGVVTERRGDAVTAEKLYQAALELEPDHSMTWNNLGNLAERAGRREEALKHISRAHELDAKNMEATYNLGALLLSSGRPAEALPLLQEAVKSRADIPMGPILLGRALAKTGQVDAARRLFTSLAASNPLALLELARVDLQAGDPSAARAHVAEALTRAGPQARQLVSRDAELAPLLSDP